MNLPKITLPAEVSYIGAFLTLDCNLNCSYCINNTDFGADRKTTFKLIGSSKLTTMTPDLWVKAFNRLEGLTMPITLQGGEPTIYWGGKGIGQILSGVNH